MKTNSSNRLSLGFAHPLKIVPLCVVALLAVQAKAGLLDKVLGNPSGKVAKWEFTLNDNMPVTSIAWSPNGRLIASASTQNKRLNVWDVQKRMILFSYDRNFSGRAMRELAWSPNGKYLAVCDANMSRLLVFDSHHWSAPHTIDNSNGDTNCVMPAFSSDSRQLAVLGNSISIYSTVDWHLIKFAETKPAPSGWGHGRKLHTIQFIPNTYTLAIGGEAWELTGRNAHNSSGYEFAGKVWLMKAEDALPSVAIEPYHHSNSSPTGDVSAMAVSPDGKAVATGTHTGSGRGSWRITDAVHILQVVDGSLTSAPLDGRARSQQGALIYSSDGRYLIVGFSGYEATDYSIELIDLKDSRIADSLQLKDDLYDIAFDSTGQRFAAGTGTKIVVWGLPK